MAGKWPGQSTILASGFLVGPDFYKGVGTLVLVVGVSVVCLVFPCRYYLEEKDNPAPLVIGCVLAFLSVTFLLLTGTLNPGFIPRQSGVYSQGPANATRINLFYQGSSKDIPVTGTLCRLRYCTTCCLFRPPRASHCHKCDACVERFDHHCPWVGNCVGKRNYAHFLGFLVTTSVLGIFGMGVSAGHIGQLSLDKDGGSDGLGDASEEAAASWVVLLLCIPACCFTTGLLIFHTYLLHQGKTTYERLKKSKQGYSSFARSSLCSYLLYICTARTPSLIHTPRHINADEEYVALSPSHYALRQPSISLPKTLLSARQEAEPLTRSPAITSDA